MILFVAETPVREFAVIVISLLPFSSGTSAVQDSSPEALPLRARFVDHRTEAIPPVWLAVPETRISLALVDWPLPDGELMLTRTSVFESSVKLRTALAVAVLRVASIRSRFAPATNGIAPQLNVVLMLLIRQLPRRLEVSFQYPIHKPAAPPTMLPLRFTVTALTRLPSAGFEIVIDKGAAVVDLASA